MSVAASKKKSSENFHKNSKFLKETYRKAYQNIGHNTYNK